MEIRNERDAFVFECTFNAVGTEFLLRKPQHGLSKLGRADSLGFTLGGLLAVSCGAFALFTWFMAKYVVVQQGTSQYWVTDVHVANLMIHGFSMAFAILLFSHGRNTTYFRIPFVAGKRVEISRLDTTGFILFLLVSTACCIGIPFFLDVYAAGPAGNSMFHGSTWGRRGNPIDLVQVCVEGATVISVAAVAIYTFHRICVCGPGFEPHRWSVQVSFILR